MLKPSFRGDLAVLSLLLLCLRKISPLSISALIPTRQDPFSQDPLTPFSSPLRKHPLSPFNFGYCLKNFRNWGWYSITQKEKRYGFAFKPQIYMDLVTSHHYPSDFCSGSVKDCVFISFSVKACLFYQFNLGLSNGCAIDFEFFACLGFV